VTARMYDYTAVDAARWPGTPETLSAFLNGMDMSGWEYVAPAGEMLVFRRRHQEPVVASPNESGGPAR